MTRRFPLLFVALALASALALTWFLFDGTFQSDEDVALSGPDVAQRAEAERGQLDRHDPTRDAERESVVRGQVLPTGSSASAIPEDALYLPGRLVFPAGLPSDEQFTLFASGLQFATGAPGPRRISIDVDADGRFRVPYSALTKWIWIDFEARYMYLGQSLRIRVRDSMEEIVLEPRVGGILRGVVTPPAGHVASAETFAGALLTLRHRRGFRFRHPEVMVSEDGHFELRALAPRAYDELELTTDRFAGDHLNYVVVRAGQITDVELALSQGVSISGRVELPSGDPAERAGVWCIGTRRQDREFVLTDAAGRFEIRGFPAGEVTLTIDEQGYVEIVDDLGALEHGDLREGIVYSLDPGLAITGVVHWEDGTAAEGVKVAVRPHGALRLRSRLSTTTNPKGEFEVGGCTEGLHVIEAEGQRTAAARQRGTDASEPKLRARVADVAAGTRGVDIVLTAGEALRGSVRGSDGQSVGRFSVKATREYDPVRRVNDWGPVGLVQTGKFDSPDGEFVLAGLEPGEWAVVASATGYAMADPILVEVPASRVDFELEPGASLTGAVQTPDGRTVTGATVQWALMRGEDRLSRQRVRLDSTSEAGGSFELPDLAAGEYRLHAEAENWAPAAPVTVQIAAGEQRDGVLLVLRPPGTVTGQVVGGVNLSIPRQIRLSGADWAKTMSDLQGRFEFSNLPPGKYTARLVSDRDDAPDLRMQLGNTPPVEFELAVGGTEHIKLGATPADAVRVHGKFTSAGSGVPGLKVYLRNEVRQVQVEGVTDDEGNYEFIVDGAGEYLLWMKPRAPGRGKYNLNIAPGAEHREDIELPAGELSVRLLDPDGAPAARMGVHLTYFPASGGAPVIGTPSTTGRTERRTFKYLPPGTYTLRVGGLGSLFLNPLSENAEEGTTAPNHERFAYTFREVQLAAGERRELTVRLELGGTLHGLATRGGTLAAPNRIVHVLDDKGRELMRTRTDDYGRFECHGMPRGRLTLRVGDVEQTVSVPPAGEVDVEVVVP